MLLPQQIAEQLTPDEMTELATKVDERWNQSYGVVSVKRSTQVTVTVELDDRTQHEVILKSSQNRS